MIVLTGHFADGDADARGDRDVIAGDGSERVGFRVAVIEREQR